MKKIDVKLLHIERVVDKQLKFTMFRKLLNDNKVHFLKETLRNPSDGVFKRIKETFAAVRRSIIRHLPPTKSMRHQLPMSQRFGGLALRPISSSTFAAQTTALALPIDDTCNHFLFDKLPIDSVLSIDAAFDPFAQHYTPSTITAFNKRSWMSESLRQQELDRNINGIIRFTFPAVFVLQPHLEHEDIIKLHGTKCVQLFNEVVSDTHKSRIRSVQSLGATTCLDVPPYEVRYTDLDYFSLLGLYLGGTFNPQNALCRKCGADLDAYGHHVLHCKKGNHLIKLRKRLRDQLWKEMSRAGWKTETEQRWTPQRMATDDVYVPETHGVPGDVLISGYFDDGRSEPDAYDVFGH